ncbi:carbon monoxide dehydrogenase small chain [Microcystis aeruginosa NIES-2520]|jgi:carbon-monoxide dehydrogenase small subunit|uniref:Carbon monoxide dehydrogenase small chain n=1 Tax=Microcystis aeruginosa NIES-2520 TaxID=2303982 RepID=A0A5A5RKR0_MICAE|nr:(2Fe-2S)-binding protein [Microcystis aeruginosa]MDJ0527231.1 (2Fe-2S)-binding protein [Microcystis sp. M53600_WE12]GCA73802.1 carbon monoxide dehydrogenase small chain [Microcystis aeruginosa NIES-2520]
MQISLKVNGQNYSADVEPRLLLLDFLREHLGLTGTKSDGGSTSGSCTVLLNGVSVKSSYILAVQADGSEVVTVEGLAGDGNLNPLQEAFWEMYAVQNGFSTPALLLSATDLLQRNPNPSEAEIRAWLDGVLSRDTGYQNVVRAVELAAQKLLVHSEVSTS